MLVFVTTHDEWDCETVHWLCSLMNDNEELAMYIDGDVVTFCTYPKYNSPDFNEYGECIETWLFCKFA